MIDWGAMLPAVAAPPVDLLPQIEEVSNDGTECLPAIASAERRGDDRRRCSECAKLGYGGRCLAAVRREIVASRTYAPHPDCLRRCEAFSPLPNDPDQRAGGDRWPGL